MNSLSYLNANLVPIGTIFPYIGTDPPNNQYLMCDGSLYDIDEYPDLYNVIKTTTTPNLVNKMIFGKGISGQSSILNNSFGSETVSVTLKVENIPLHTHTVTLSNSGGHQHETSASGGHTHDRAFGHLDADDKQLYYNHVDDSGAHTHAYDVDGFMGGAPNMQFEYRAFSAASADINSGGSYIMGAGGRSEKHGIQPKVTNGRVIGTASSGHTHAVDESDSHKHDMPTPAIIQHAHTIPALMEVGETQPTPIEINTVPKCYGVNYIIRATSKT